MNGKRVALFVVIGATALVGALLAAAGAWAAPGPAPIRAPYVPSPVSHTISYQGLLFGDSDQPVNGTRTLTFTLYTLATGGSPLASHSCDVAVENGLFTAQFDVEPSLFDGQALWLGIQVAGDAEEMAPRQPLLPAPYAFYALSAPWSGLTGVPAGLADTWRLNGNPGTTPGTHVLGTLDPVSLTLVVSGTPAFRLETTAATPNVVAGASANGTEAWVTCATIGGGGLTGYPNRVTGHFGTVSGGYLNHAGDTATVSGGYANSAEGYRSAVGGGTGNDATATDTTISGGFSNTASGTGATAGGGYYNTASGDYATVGGGYQDTASGGYATVGGGRKNIAGLSYATASGGYSNTVSATYATVGGGDSNTASGIRATVSGGYDNNASGGDATVGGGVSNQASGPRATVGGGWGNNATGDYATVPGGYENSAGSDYSFAAGLYANASHSGSFVWSSGGSSTASWGSNTFTARASGGVRFYSQGTGVTGVYLAPGSTTWGTSSDRNIKENFRDVDLTRLLQTLAGMPIQSWNLKAQDPAIRHLGPVAQDFNADFSYLFGQVEDPLYVNSGDETGIALAAAQALYDLSEQQAAEISDLRAENESMRAELDDVQARLAALEGGGVQGMSLSLSSPWWLMGGLLVAGLAWRRRGAER